MRNNRLGCLSSTGILAALITVLVIAGYAYARGGLLFNPGPLNAQGNQTLGGVTSHAEIGGECKACHTAPWEGATMADRCLTCHTNIAQQMQDANMLHGTLFQADPTLACRDCHPEHHGADAPLTVMEDVPFPHEVVGFSLNGHQLTAAREPFACNDCHHNDITSFAPETCDTCHRQMDIAYMTAHALSFGSACLACHDGMDHFDENFDHNVFSFPLTGSHAGLACVQCHINARGLVDFAAAPQDCFSCHQQDDAHNGQFGTDCAACHNTTAWIPSTFTGQHTFPLNHGGGATCATCHSAGFTTYTCYGCHEHNEAEVIERHLDKDIPNFQNCMECHPSGEKD
jgi:hypothetical protein